MSVTPMKPLNSIFLIERMPVEELLLTGGEYDLVFDYIEGGSYEYDAEFSSRIPRIPLSPKATNEMR